MLTAPMMLTAQEPIVPIVPQTFSKESTKKLSKAVLVSVDQSEPSKRALIWAFQNFADEDVTVKKN